MARAEDGVLDGSLRDSVMLGLCVCRDDCAWRVILPLSRENDGRPIGRIVDGIRLEAVAEGCCGETEGAVIVGTRNESGTEGFVPDLDSV